nr:hypothetical protein [Paracoccus mutanolyticus]
MATIAPADLLTKGRKLAEDSITVIERTRALAEPLPVAATFDFRDENGDSLSDVSRSPRPRPGQWTCR